MLPRAGPLAMRRGPALLFVFACCGGPSLGAWRHMVLGQANDGCLRWLSAGEPSIPEGRVRNRRQVEAKRAGVLAEKKYPNTYK